MTTQAQINANRQNALKGGVKTHEGKEISKYNAVKHRVLTKILLFDEHEEARLLCSELASDYSPGSRIEQMLVETIAIAYIRRLRALKAEKEYFKQVLNPDIYKLGVVQEPIMPNEIVLSGLSGQYEKILVQSGYKAKVPPEVIDNISRNYARYITSCERQLYKALQELRNTRK